MHFLGLFTLIYNLNIIIINLKKKKKVNGD